MIIQLCLCSIISILASCSSQQPGEETRSVVPAETAAQEAAPAVVPKRPCISKAEYQASVEELHQVQVTGKFTPEFLAAKKKELKEMEANLCED